jgi:hypothetical protein
VTAEILGPMLRLSSVTAQLVMAVRKDRAVDDGRSSDRFARSKGGGGSADEQGRVRPHSLISGGMDDSGV